MALDDQDIRYLDSKFGSVHETLTRIDTQVTKTNGRVDCHDVKFAEVESKLKWLPGVAICLGVVIIYLVAFGVIPPSAFK